MLIPNSLPGHGCQPRRECPVGVPDDIRTLCWCRACSAPPAYLIEDVLRLRRRIGGLRKPLGERFEFREDLGERASLRVLRSLRLVPLLRALLDLLLRFPDRCQPFLPPLQRVPRSGGRLPYGGSPRHPETPVRAEFEELDCARCGTVWRDAAPPAAGHLDGLAYAEHIPTTRMIASATRWHGRWLRSGRRATSAPRIWCLPAGRRAATDGTCAERGGACWWRRAASAPAPSP